MALNAACSQPGHFPVLLTLGPTETGPLWGSVPLRLFKGNEWTWGERPEAKGAKVDNLHVIL